MYLSHKNHRTSRLTGSVARHLLSRLGGSFVLISTNTMATLRATQQLRWMEWGPVLALNPVAANRFQIDRSTTPLLQGSPVSCLRCESLKYSGPRFDHSRAPHEPVIPRLTPTPGHIFKSAKTVQSYACTDHLRILSEDELAKDIQCYSCKLSY